MLLDVTVPTNTTKEPSDRSYRRGPLKYPLIGRDYA